VVVHSVAVPGAAVAPVMRVVAVVDAVPPPDVVAVVQW
jgi:hypothetical protein